MDEDTAVFCNVCGWEGLASDCAEEGDGLVCPSCGYSDMEEA